MGLNLNRKVTNTNKALIPLVGASNRFRLLYHNALIFIFYCFSLNKAPIHYIVTSQGKMSVGELAVNSVSIFTICNFRFMSELVKTIVYSSNHTTIN